MANIDVGEVPIVAAKRNRFTVYWVISAALIMLAGGFSAHVVFFSLQRDLKSQIERIRLETAALAPIAYSRFCMQYEDDCQVRRMAFRRPHPEALSAERMQDLLKVNRDVNREIVPQADAGSLLDERWRVAPEAGACHDYAVTKRHELLARGWPSRALLLAEVVVPWGEHHLVLVVRTDKGDLVLDNLTADVRLWSQTPYQWVRIQSPGNPNFWFKVTQVAA